MNESAELLRLREDVAALEWYHTLELRPGVVTPGWFDLRDVSQQIPWPDLAGLRCLDIGTFDGFWAFEMERRGAGEVLAIDLLDPAQWDWPVMSTDEAVAAIGKRKSRGEGFDVARTALRSSVERREMSVYDLDPDAVGTFDLVYLGSLLLHLRDPVRALERARGVCRGNLIVVDAIDFSLTELFRNRPLATLDGRGRPWWWKPNLAGLARMLEAAGFEIVGRPKRLFMPAGAGQPVPRFRPRLLASRAGREAVLLGWRGEPHACVRARPRR